MSMAPVLNTTHDATMSRGSTDAPYRRILIPTDGSDSAMSAAEVGLDLAQRFGARVTVISIVDVKALVSIQQGLGVPDIHSYQQESADASAEAVMELAAKMGVAATSIVKRGDPASDIVQESAKHDLIVMATHGRTGVSHLLLGSVAEKVVRFAACPVMVIRNRQR